jgi:hypothetical protein
MNRSNTLLHSAGVALLLLAAATHGQAAVYDLRADWSDAANSNGAWTYRAGGVTLPSVPNWDKDPGADAAWAPSAAGGNFLPAWFRAVADNHAFLTGDIVVHTTDNANGAGNGAANVLWTSPSAGLATISGGLWDAREIGRAQHWELFVDGVLADLGDLPGTSVDGISRATPDAFSLTNVALDAGDFVELRITRSGAPGDFVGVNLSIDLEPRVDPQIPEPVGAALIGVGLVGLAWARRRPVPAVRA